MFGLVILPNGYENHRRLLPEIEQKLRLDGKKVTWTNVHSKDYCVRQDQVDRKLDSVVRTILSTRLPLYEPHTHGAAVL